MSWEEGLHWLEEENRVLRGRLRELERIQRLAAGTRPPESTGTEVPAAGATGRHDCLRTEEALRNSERRWRVVFETSRDGIIIIDDQLRLLEANPGAERIFGMARRDLSGRTMSEFFDGGSDRELAWACFLDARDYSGEDSIRRPDGKVSEVEVFGRANIAPGQHLFILHEITERKRMGGPLVPGFPFHRARGAVA